VHLRITDAIIAIMDRELKMPARCAESLYDRYYGPNALGVTPDGVLDIEGYRAATRARSQRRPRRASAMSIAAIGTKRGARAISRAASSGTRASETIIGAPCRRRSI